MRSDNLKWKVFVRCFTYNQAKYITDAMDGFTKQNTTFPYVCGIVDDSSTDGENKVIREYVESYFTKFRDDKETSEAFFTYWQHKVNKNCQFIYILLKYNHYSINKSKDPYLKFLRENSEYEALCEGDDFWIDPLKLQKQVDYMDTHKDIGLCFTDFNVYHQETGEIEKSVLEKQPTRYPYKYTIESWILSKKYIGPMTWMYRCNILDQIPNLNGVDRTFVWVAFFLTNSKIGCMLHETTSVYRVSCSGVSHPKNIKGIHDRSVGLLKLQLQLAEMYVNKDSFKDVIIRQWVNGGNLTLCFICRDKNGIEFIGQKFSYLSLRNKIIFIFIKSIPILARFIIKKRMQYLHKIQF